MRLLPLALLLSAAALSAQPSALVYGGYALEAGYANGAAYLAPEADETVTLNATGGLIVGLGAELPVFENRFPIHLAVRPSVEATFVPKDTQTFVGGDALTIRQFVLRGSAEFIARFPLAGPVEPSVGLGMSYARYTSDFDGDGAAAVGGGERIDRVTAWAFGPSLTAGLAWTRPGVSPFIHARYRFASPQPDFPTERPGTDLDNRLSLVAGARFGL